MSGVTCLIPSHTWLSLTDLTREYIDMNYIYSRSSKLCQQIDKHEKGLILECRDLLIH